LATPAFIQYFVNNALEPAGSTPAEFQALIATELQMWRKLIKDANISANAL
jgi:tripartite-type tricarboxylate transporter receptor subunit TctC